MPSTVPIAEATTPTTTASATTMRNTCLRLEPMARSIAVSLVRCATVIEKALKITNPPTTRATTANTSRNVLMNDMPCWLSAAGRVDRGLARDAPRRSASRRSASRDPGRELGLRDARRADRAHAVDTTGLAQHAWPRSPA